MAIFRYVLILIFTPIYLMLAYCIILLICSDVYSVSSPSVVPFSFWYWGPVHYRCSTFLLSPYKNTLPYRLWCASNYTCS